MKINLRQCIVKFFAALCILTLFACSKDKPKIIGNYVDIDTSIASAKPDSSLDQYDIEIPSSEVVKGWHSSNFSLRSIPQNIKSNINIDNSDTYKVFSSLDYAYVNRTPVFSGNNMFVLDDKGYLYSYAVDSSKSSKSRKSGVTQVWKVQLGKSKDGYIGGGVFVKGKHIAVTYGDKELVLMDSSNGEIIWRYSVGNISRVTPVIYQDYVIAMTVDNKVYCIDLATGVLRWSSDGASEQFGIIGGASPEVSDEGVVVVPLSSGNVAAFNLLNGEKKWNIKLGHNPKQVYLNDINSTPLIDGGHVYISNHGGDLFSVSLENGTVEWVNQSAGGNSLWIAEDFIYSINKDNHLLSVYKETGVIKWAYDLPKHSKLKSATSAKYSGPIMVNGSLYIVSSAGELVVIAAKTGKRIKSTKVDSSIFSPPVVVGEKMYLISNSGVLMVFQ